MRHLPRAIGGASGTTNGTYDEVGVFASWAF
jgi:hypothetical protein